MRVSIATPESHFVSQSFIEWGKLIEEKTKGEIKVQVYVSAQLFRDNEVVAAVQNGSVEAGNTQSQYLENQLVPGMKVLQLPFFFKNLQEVLKVIDSPIGDEWRKTAERKGVLIVGTVSFPSPDGEGFTTTKPAKLPSDVKGMVLRTVSPELSAQIKKWGAGPSFLTGAEVYMALQRGTLQGAVANLASYVDRKWYEVSPYFIMLPYGSVNNFLAVNKAFFDRLTPTQQKAITDAGAIMSKKNYEVAMASMARDITEAKKKAHLYTPTPAELAKWTEGSEEIWAEAARNNKDLADAMSKVRALLKR